LEVEIVARKKRVLKFEKLSVDIHDRTLTLYAGQRVINALAELTADMDVYLFTRFQIAMRAVYEQGLKDGRAEVIARSEEVKSQTNYLAPGRPKVTRRVKG
jgi:hypothetical protein